MLRQARRSTPRFTAASRNAVQIAIIAEELYGTQADKMAAGGAGKRAHQGQPKPLTVYTDFSADGIRGRENGSPASPTGGGARDQGDTDEAAMSWPGTVSWG
jgi:hypothetical protein